MVTQRVVRQGVNPNIVREAAGRPGDCLVSEASNYGCRGNLMVTAGSKAIPHNSVVADANGDFAIVVFEGVPANTTAYRGGITNGLCELAISRLHWPSAPVAADGPDAGSDNLAEQAAADAALVAKLKGQMAAKLIKLVV